MKLHSTKLERELRRRVRSEIKRSPELKRESKRIQRRYSMPPMVLFWFFGTMLVLSGMDSLWKEGGLQAQLVCVTLLSLFLVFWMASHLMNTLYSSPALEAFFHLPILDADVFERQWMLFVRKSSGFMFAFLIMFGSVGFSNGYDLWGWLGLLFLIIGQWWVCLITAVWMCTRFPRLPYGAVVVSGGLGLFVIMITHEFLSPAVIGFVLKLADTPYWIIPPGWLTLVIESFHSKNYLIALGAFGLVAAFSYSVRFALLRLRQGFCLAEPTEATDSSNEYDDEVPLRAAAGPGYAVGPTEILDDIRQRTFLTDDAPDELPWFERLLMRGFNARQRMIARFAMDETAWSARWRGAAILVSVLVIATIFVRESSWRPSIILYFVGTYILGARFLSLTNPLGRAFTPSFFSGTNVPWYSGFPLSYHELSQIIIKLNCIRLLAFAPLVFVYGIATAVLYNYGWHQGAEITAKALCLLFVAQPAIAVFFFSSGTNDTSRSGYLSMLGVLGFAFAVIVFLGLAGASLFLENDGYAALCILAAGVISLGFHRTYGWAFNRGRFDLMQLPQQI
ncbi:MAG: hypothetical protein H0X66_07640 [Verrucomicrobia bacterium]|nr:hypothetical protein [Verrucomicrobiota bacterium]